MGPDRVRSSGWACWSLSTAPHVDSHSPLLPGELACKAGVDFSPVWLLEVQAENPALESPAAALSLPQPCPSHSLASEALQHLVLPFSVHLGIREQGSGGSAVASPPHSPPLTYGSTLSLKPTSCRPPSTPSASSGFQLSILSAVDLTCGLAAPRDLSFRHCPAASRVGGP